MKIISSTKINKLPNGDLAYIERELHTEYGLNFNSFLITDRLVTFKEEIYLDELEQEQTRIVKVYHNPLDSTQRSRRPFNKQDSQVATIRDSVNSFFDTNLDPLVDKFELFMKAMILESNVSYNGTGLYGCTNWVPSEGFVGEI